MRAARNRWRCCCRRLGGGNQGTGSLRTNCCGCLAGCCGHRRRAAWRGVCSLGRLGGRLGGCRLSHGFNQAGKWVQDAGWVVV